jgi:tetratricopeptide (TPR) repeat protein
MLNLMLAVITLLNPAEVLNVTAEVVDPPQTHVRETSRLLCNLGALYAQTGRRQAAMTVFSRALRILEQYEPDDPHMAILLSNLGTLHVQNGDYKQARKHLHKALDLAQKRLAADDRDFIPILTNLGALYERQKKWTAAESYLLRALHVADHWLQPDDPERALVLEHLGLVHFRQNKLLVAESELRRALEIEGGARGLESIRGVSVSLNLAKVLTAARQYDEARILYGRSLPVQERLLGTKTPEVATTLENFAGLLHTMKSHEPADEMQARAGRIRAELAYTRSVNDGPW